MTSALPMSQWNAIATVREGRYREACRLLEDFGRVVHTDYYNVLALIVPEPAKLLEEIEVAIEAGVDLASAVARIVPAPHTFVFQSAGEFEQGARRIAESWLEKLAGKRFHVRVHRRGFSSALASQAEERRLGRHLLDQLAAHGSGAEVDFDDPDAVILIETLGQWAGVSIWAREDIQRHPLLGIV